MRITLWMSERSLEQFHKGELVEGMVFHREPGEHVDAVQVNVTYDEYRQIQDQQTNPKTWECSLPDGAEWDVSYSIKEQPTFADVYDITRATPNDMELGGIIRKMVNDSDE